MMFTIIELAKTALRVVGELKNQELNQILFEIQTKALDVQLQNAELIGENERLKCVKGIEGQMLRSSHGTSYFHLEGDSGSPYKIPYCAICWGKHKQLIPMNITFQKKLKCHSCSNETFFNEPIVSDEQKELLRLYEKARTIGNFENPENPWKEIVEFYIEKSTKQDSEQEGDL